MSVKRGDSVSGKKPLSLREVRLLIDISLCEVLKSTPPLKEFKARWQRKRAGCIAHLSGARGRLPASLLGTPCLAAQASPRCLELGTCSLDSLEEGAYSAATATILELGDPSSVTLSLVTLGRSTDLLLTSMPLNKCIFCSIHSWSLASCCDRCHSPTPKTSEPSALGWVPAAPCTPTQRKIALDHHQVALGGVEGSRLIIPVEQRRAATPTPKLGLCPSLFFLLSLESLCAFKDSFLMNLGSQR